MEKFMKEYESSITTGNKKVLDTERKRKEDFAKLQSKVDAIRQKTNDPTKWNASELQTMVSWFKRPGDSTLLQCKDQLLRRYLLTCNHSEQERNRLKEGEEPVHRCRYLNPRTYWAEAQLSHHRASGERVTHPLERGGVALTCDQTGTSARLANTKKNRCQRKKIDVGVLF